MPLNDLIHALLTSFRFDAVRILVLSVMRLQNILLYADNLLLLLLSLLLFNYSQQSTINTQTEYKYRNVFVLQETSLTGFSQTSLRPLVLRKR